MPDIENVTLTPEMRAKLKGFLGFQVEASFEYVPKAYRDEKNAVPREIWPVFTLKSKDGLEIAKEQEDIEMALDRDTRTSRMVLHPGPARLRTLRAGLLGVRRLPLEDGSRLSWDNKTEDLTFANEKGEKVKERNHVSVDKVIAFLPTSLQIELQTAIDDRDVMAPEELRGLG